MSDVMMTVVGRGRVGRALAAAWGPRAQLLPHDATISEGAPLILAVPDKAIAEVAARFPRHEKVHLSGSLHLDDVPCAHPLTSFDGTAADWRGTPLALTGAPPPAIVRAFEDLGFVPFALPAELKALYHAAAVFTSGHAATLWLGAEKVLRDHGVTLPGRGLWPLAEATVANLRARGAAGRTGPFVRGDAETIARDAAALPEPWRALFLAIGALYGSTT